MSNPKTILVIDDEKDLRETVEYQLKAKGFNVVTACDGLDGLERLKTVSPDLIILDMNMPRMNGVEFYIKIKGNDEKPKHPVLILTARANMEQLFTDLDVDGFMAKPFELHQLVKEVATIIKKNSGAIQIKGEKGFKEMRARSVCIVENEPEQLSQIAIALLEAGYIVNSAPSGASAIKRILMDVPDLVVIKLELDDIAGDITIAKLKGWDKTKNIKFVLYTLKSADEGKITKKIADKVGIKQFVEYTHANDLLEAADLLF